MATLLRVVFVSVYQFLNSEELITQFRNTKAGDGCYTSFQDGEFVVEYPEDRHQLVVVTFLGLMKDYVELEKTKMEKAEEMKQQGLEPDMFEVPRVSRMSHTTVEYFIDPYLVEIDDERIIVESSYTEQQPLGEVVVELGGLIPHEVVQRTLETGIDPKLVKLFSADGVLKKVGDLTNCSITHRDGSRILVKGDTEQEVAKAMAKLRVKVDEINFQANGFPTYDFQIHENEQFVEYHFSNLTKVLDRRLLLQIPRLQSEYLELHMAKWNGIIAQWTRMDQVSRGIQQEPVEIPGSQTCRLWTDKTYPALGDQRLAVDEVARSQRLLSASLDHPVAAWNESVPLDEVIDPFANSSGDDEAQPSVPEKDIGTKVYTAKRVVKGRELKPPQQPVGPPAIVPPPIRPPHMPSHEDVSSNERDAPPANWRMAVVRGGPTGNLLCDSSAPRNGLIGSQRTNRLQQNARPVRRNVIQNQVQGQISSQERLHNQAERNSRTIRRGPNLRARAGHTKPVLEDDVFPEIQVALIHILEMSRAYADVKFEVALGRIYVKSADISKEFVNQGLKLDEWSMVFGTVDSGRHANTILSKTLSTSFVDAEYILDLKIKNAKRMFHEEPIEQKITYELKCLVSTSKESLFVDIDQEGVRKVRDETRMIGAVNCHFPRRTWDASFLVTSTPKSKTKTLDLIDSFWVKEGELVSLGGTTVLGTEVISVTVRRQTIHACTGRGRLLLLHLTEVQDLIVVQGHDRHFKAYAAKENAMTTDGNRLWWEASISSQYANDILQADHVGHVEFGELAAWTAEHIIEVVPGMFELLREVVTRMDGVGRHAQGLIAQRSVGSKSQTRIKTKTPTGTMLSRNHGWTQW